MLTPLIGAGFVGAGNCVRSALVIVVPSVTTMRTSVALPTGSPSRSAVSTCGTSLGATVCHGRALKRSPVPASARHCSGMPCAASVNVMRPVLYPVQAARCDATKFGPGTAVRLRGSLSPFSLTAETVTV